MWMVILTALSISNLIILTVIGLFFNKTILARIAIMLDNNRRLELEQQLNSRLAGNDEISALDTSFHEMSEALKDSTRKYTSIINNAQDLICSTDDQGKFIFANPSAQTLLKYQPEELAGTWFMDIVAVEEQAKAARSMRDIADSTQEMIFETRLLQKDGQTIDALCSASRSPYYKSVFYVIHDISERKKAERLQREVTKIISRDLQNPLLALENFHNELQSGKIANPSPKLQKQIDLCVRTTSRMLTLVRDLQDSEQIESGTLELDRKCLSTTQLFQDAFHAVSTQANQQKVNLNAGNDDIKVFADPHRIMQILVNLLSNAIKFSPPDSTVSVFARTLNADYVEFQVHDQGRGIPEEIQSSIFDRFKQTHSSDATSKGGTGLGLAICKSLVEIHGGTIKVNSVLGKGSVFSFTIANKAETAPLKMARKAESKFGDKP